MKNRNTPYSLVIVSRSTLLHKASGGMETQAHSLAREWLRQGHNVVVVTTVLPRGNDREIYEGVPYLGVPGTTPGEYSPAWWENSRLFLTQYVQVHSIDGVISESVAAAGYARRSSPAPILWIAHGSLTSEVLTCWESCRSVRDYLHFFLRLLPYAFYTFLALDLRFQRVFPGCAVSRAVAREVERELFLSAGHVPVVYNGINTADFAPATSEVHVRLRTQYQLPLDACILLTAGRLIPEKGVQRVLAHVLKWAQHRPVHLVIAGDGPYREELEAQAAELGIASSVSFLGECTYAEMPGVYQLADLFLFPSTRREGFPMTIIEAQACGLPVVTTLTGGTGEAVVSGETGLVVPRGDEDALSTAVSDLIQQDELRHSYGIAAAARARSLFSEAAMANGVLSRWESTMASHS